MSGGKKSAVHFLMGLGQILSSILVKENKDGGLIVGTKLCEEKKVKLLAKLVYD